MRVRLLSALFALCLSGCPPPGGDFSKDPVAFLPGWGLAGLDSSAAMRAALVQRSWPASHLSELAYENQFGCIEFSAENLATAVDDILAATGKTRVDLVGHSMGGIVARYYVKNLGGAAKVRDVVTLASPNHGSTFFAGGEPGCAQRQMQAGDPFILTLNDPDETPGGPDVKWTAVVAEFDDLVLPPTSAQLAGAANLTLPTTHLLLITWADLFDPLADALDGAGANDD